MPLSVKEAAARTRVTLRTVYRWCQKGVLRARKVGGVWRVFEVGEADTLPDLEQREERKR